MKLKAKLPKNFFVGFIFLIMLSSCNSKNDTTGPAVVEIQVNEPASFTNSPFDISKLSSILSLGWLEPVGHTIPTDHIYFSFNQTGTDSIPVYAPGPGLVKQILLRPIAGKQECKVWVEMNAKFSYYLDHVILDSSIKTGNIIKGGQVIGTSGLGNTIDFGAIDSNVNNGFINPARYNSQTVRCGRPLSYFTDPLKSQLYSLVDREGTEKDGWVCVDVPKTLSGNWFYDNGLFNVDGPNGWDTELAFAYDIQHPSRVMISIGGIIGLIGKWNIISTDILPSQANTSTGKITYHLCFIDPNYPNNPPIKKGLMIVQLTDDTHIKVETFTDITLTDAVFDSNAKIYAR